MYRSTAKVGLVILLICFAAVIASSAQNIPLSLPSSTAVLPGATTNPVVPPVPAPDNPANIKLGPGDLVHVSLYGEPNFERDIRISDSGKIALPFIGDLDVAGLTSEAAQKRIERLLVEGGFFADPQVSVLIKEYATQGVSVLGEVQKPGIYPLLGPHTLFDAISAAGGTTPKAGREVTITRRKQLQSPEVVELSYDPTGSTKTNVTVEPGDTVVVSKAGMVYVVGDVKQPTGIVLESPDLTVLQAIALAQGTNAKAALNKSKVIRKGPNGTEEILVPLKKMLAAKAPDVKLQADDVLFVPNSLAKSAAARTLDAAIATLSGVIVYGARPY